MSPLPASATGLPVTPCHRSGGWGSAGDTVSPALPPPLSRRAGDTVSPAQFIRSRHLIEGHLAVPFA